MNYKMDVSLNEILEIYSQNHKVGNKQGIKRAYAFAAKCHAGQKRGTGEPYIKHPLRAARFVAEWGAESDVIIAALLHDVAEDCDVPLSYINEHFGSNVGDIVNAVTALSDKDFANHTLTKKQKDILSDAKMQTNIDLKSLYVKIADRIDNLCTLDGVRPEKRIPKAEHTREIIIPMARLAKADRFADILEELCFKIEHNGKFKRIEKEYHQLLDQNAMTCKESLKALKSVFHPSLNSKLSGLKKYHEHIKDFFHSERSYISISRQMNRLVQNLENDWPAFFNKYNIELYDLTLIVSDDLLKENSGLRPNEIFFQYFDKALAPRGFYLIKYGFAASTGAGYFQLADEMDNLYRLFVRTELEYNRYLYGSIVDPDSDFFIPNVNRVDPRDTYNEQIKVYRKDGTAMSIDKGATVLDFAFYIHPNIGLHFDYAMVDESVARLHRGTRLNDGDRITIASDELIKPEIAWFNDVNTSLAKHYLVKYFQRLKPGM